MPIFSHEGFDICNVCITQCGTEPYLNCSLAKYVGSMKISVEDNSKNVICHYLSVSKFYTLKPSLKK